jgi:hypothetical protein
LRLRWQSRRQLRGATEAVLTTLVTTPVEIHTPFKNTVTPLSCRVEIHGLGLLGLRILKDMAVIVTQQVALQTVTHGPQRPRPTEVTVEIAVATHGRANE